MTPAVILWNAQQQKEALGQVSLAEAQRPEWKTARWVAALYSPTVANSIAAMDREQERLREARHHTGSPLTP